MLIIPNYFRLLHVDATQGHHPSLWGIIPRSGASPLALALGFSTARSVGGIYAQIAAKRIRFHTQLAILEQKLDNWRR
jgi:hypothetical protein